MRRPLFPQPVYGTALKECNCPRENRLQVLSPFSDLLVILEKDVPDQR
jgi:hypothetical protein